MTDKERRSSFKKYLEEKYKPFLTNAENVFKMHASLSSSLKEMDQSFTSVFSVDDPSKLQQLLSYIKNPSRGSLAFGRQVQNMDLKKAFLNHYEGFLASLTTSLVAEPEDESAEEAYIEGQLKETKFFRRKRNRKLRDDCIHKYGCTCYVCGMDFEKIYGPRGHMFIEVHHLNPMATYDNEHSITPDELRPLCSNCHSMIHKDPNGGTTEIEKFKAEYRTKNGK